jgi:transposase InsO family protein
MIGYEREKVLEIAKNNPELSCRLIAVKICDEEDFSISESTVYRMLKEAGLITPRPEEERPAGDEWYEKTTKVDQIWQTDATVFFIVGWGYYKLINVLDDYSRYILSSELRPDETGRSISMAVEMAIEEAKRLGHLQGEEKPRLLSDNGSGNKSEEFGGYLKERGIKHIFGKPYHPQTQGKIERFHRRMKRDVCLMVYCSPEELKEAIGKWIARYRITPHKSLKNVSPIDVYSGRQEDILAKRKIKKELTLIRRKMHNQSRKNGGETTDEVSKS